MDGWMYGWMDGLMYGWMDGWMMDGLIYMKIYNFYFYIYIENTINSNVMNTYITGIAYNII